MKESFLLTPNETLELDLRTPVLLWMPRFVLAVGWVLLPLFFLVILLREGTVGLFIFAAVLLSGSWFFLSTWRRFRHTRFVLTSTRAVWINQKGVLSKDIEEMPLTRLKGVQIRQRGLTGALFKYGKIRLETEGGARLVCGPLPSARAVQEKILFLLTDRVPRSRV
jgi:uncharacterized membrane protein YdbT with pleckstrin-like domain